MLHQYVLNLTAAETTPPSTTSYWLSDKPIGALRPPRAGPLVVTWLSFNAPVFSRDFLRISTFSPAVLPLTYFPLNLLKLLKCLMAVRSC